MSREPKRNKTKLEKLMMETWYETDKGKLVVTDEQAKIVNAIKATLRYFEMEDYLYGSKHSNIFIKVYLSNENYKKPDTKLKTKIGFAKELYVGENTISRYTNLYIRCFEKNLQS